MTHEHITYEAPTSSWGWLFSSEMVTLGILMIAASPLGMVLPDGNIYRYLMLFIGGSALVPAAGYYFTHGRNRFFWLLVLGYFEFLSWLHVDGDMELQQVLFRYVCFMAFFAGQGLFVANYIQRGRTRWVYMEIILSIVGLLLIPGMVAWVVQGQEALTIRSGRFTLGELNAVGVAFLFGNVFAISITLFLFCKRFSKAVWTGTALLSLLIVLQTASRGPLLAAVVVAIVPILFAVDPTARRSRLTSVLFGLGLVALISTVIVSYFPEQFEFLTRRINRLLESDTDLNRASSGRIDIWMHYINLREEWIWFGNPRFGGEADAYAHNVFLDIGISFGLVGIVFLLVQLFFISKLLIRQ